MANRTVASTTPQRSSRVSGRPAVDALDRRLETAQRAVLLTVAALVGVAVWRPAFDPFMLPKFTVVLVGLIVLLVLAAVRALRSAELHLPVGPVVWIVAALAAALVLATVTADDPVLALVGRQRRYSGLVSYLAYLLLFLFCLRLFAGRSVRRLAQVVVVAAGITSAYGLVQVAGLDPWSWSARLDATIFSTMGNTNFSAAYVAMVLPVAAALAVSAREARAWRVGAVLTIGLGMAYILATQASQGPIAAVAGLAVVAVAWLRSRRGADDPPQSRSRATTAAALGGGLVTLVLLVLLGIRLAPDVLDSSLGERVQFWQASLRIFADSPLLGSGLDSFRDYFHRFRPVEHALDRSYQGADASHNVPLSMLAGGGLPLGLTYLAFVGFTGWALVRGLLGAVGDRFLALAGFGGMWVAYQVQSLVSFDVPGVAFQHYLAAGVLLSTVAPPRTASVRLPLSSAPRGKVLPRSSGAARGVAVGLLAAVLLTAVGSAWLAARPLRADLAANQGRLGEDKASRLAAERAVALAPWEAEYRLILSNSQRSAGINERADAEAIAAAELRRGSAKLAIGAASAALRAGDKARALQWVGVALIRDPFNPDAYEDAAPIAKSAGAPDIAAGYLARARELRAQGAGS